MNCPGSSDCDITAESRGTPSLTGNRVENTITVKTENTLCFPYQMYACPGNAGGMGADMVFFNQI